MTTAEQEPVVFNPLQPGYMEDPYSHFAEVRSAQPVHQIFDRWGLFRYEDCFKVLRDATLSVEDENSDLMESDRVQQFQEIAAKAGVDAEPDSSMLSTDPPDHTRLRRLVTKAFTPRTIEALRPRIQELVDTELDRMEADGHADVVAQLAFPLPFDVISEMLGMPDSDKEKIKGWSAAMVKTLDPILTEQEITESIEANINMDAHINSVVEWKRANPGDDLLTALIEAEEDGDRLTAKELASQVTLLFIAGHETTVNLIGTGIYELLRNPEQLALWRDDAAIGTNAPDELLRYISPVQFSRRIATADIEFGDTVLPARSFIMAMLASANRDPEKWGDDADQLDLTRDGAGQHLSFGSGVHYCLGASLAKLEADVAIGSFIRRFPNATLAAEPQWNGRLNLRGLETLPLKVS